MALVLKDRVKETCTGTSGDMALTGAVSGFVAFDADATFDSNTTYYTLEDADGTKWEVGVGTLSADSTTLTRTTILATQVSFTDTTRQTFSGGTHTIFCGYPAGKSVHLDASGGLSHTVDLTSEVTGNLPDGNIASAATWNAKQAALTFGIAVGNALKVDPLTDSPFAGEFALFSDDGLHGRTSAEVRGDLDLEPGTDVQVYDADLAAIAGLTSAADKGIQFTGSGTAATYDLTAAGKALLDDADAAAQRTTLGLGSAATTDISVANGSDNRVATFSDSDSLNGETNLTFDGGILTLNGGLVKNTDTVTAATYTVDDTGTDSIILCDGTSNAIDITLPDAAAEIVGRILTIKKIDSSTNSVDIIGSTTGGYGADDIDEFNLKYTLYAQHDTITIVCGEGDGTASDYQWWIIGEQIKPHVARMRATSTQTISDTSNVKLQFDTADFATPNSGDGTSDDFIFADTTNDKIKIQRPGKYHVYAQYWLQQFDGPGIINIYKNGSKYQTGRPSNQTTTNATFSAQVMAIMDLVVGDTIEVYAVIWDGGGADATTMLSESWGGGLEGQPNVVLEIAEVR